MPALTTGLVAVGIGVVAVAAVVVALVFVLAAVVIGREARRLDAMPARATVEMDEQVLWIADRLPDDVTAQLSFGDVRQILEWHLGYLSAHGLEVSGGDPRVVDTPVVVEGSTSVDHVLLQAAGIGAGYTLHQVSAVIDHQLAYLAEIGAVGPEADASELG